jgi:hypothetical protein
MTNEMWQYYAPIWLPECVAFLWGLAISPPLSGSHISIKYTTPIEDATQWMEGLPSIACELLISRYRSAWFCLWFNLDSHSEPMRPGMIKLSLHKSAYREGRPDQLSDRIDYRARFMRDLGRSGHFFAFLNHMFCPQGRKDIAFICQTMIRIQNALVRR